MFEDWEMLIFMEEFGVPVRRSFLSAYKHVVQDLHWVFEACNVTTVLPWPCALGKVTYLFRAFASAASLEGFSSSRGSKREASLSLPFNLKNSNGGFLFWVGGGSGNTQ